MTDKTLEMVRDTLKYLSQESLQDLLFKDPKARLLPHYLDCEKLFLSLIITFKSSAFLIHYSLCAQGEPYKKELEGIVRGAWIKIFKDAKK